MEQFTLSMSATCITQRIQCHRSHMYFWTQWSLFMITCCHTSIFHYLEMCIIVCRLKRLRFMNMGQLIRLMYRKMVFFPSSNIILPQCGHNVVAYVVTCNTTLYQYKYTTTKSSAWIIEWIVHLICSYLQIMQDCFNIWDKKEVVVLCCLVTYVFWMETYLKTYLSSVECQD